MEEINKTEDFGYTEIEIAKVGDYIGSDAEGNPVPEHFTEDSLRKVVDIANDEGKEILVDKQHLSMKDADKRDDAACGWLKALSFRNGSIFGKVFWTKLGHELVTSRIFRFVSPVFKLNTNNEPEKLVNVALVNMPALANLKPIVNSAPVDKEILIENEKGILDMTKEELAAMVAEMIDAKLADAKKAEAVEEVKEEIKEEAVDNACSDDKEEVKNTETETMAEEAVEEVKEEAVPEVEEEEEKKEEVIKIEALNSQPKTEGIDIIKNTSPKAHHYDCEGYAVVTKVS